MEKILCRIREVKATADAKEAALLLQAGNWIAFGAAFNGETVTWLLGRITNQTSGVPGAVPGISDCLHATP